MDKKVIGPLTLTQFGVMVLSAAVGYMYYLYYGPTGYFWILTAALAAGNLLYLKSGK